VSQCFVLSIVAALNGKRRTLDCRTSYPCLVTPLVHISTDRAYAAIRAMVGVAVRQEVVAHTLNGTASAPFSYSSIISP
jgi:hypothetical protein